MRSTSESSGREAVPTQGCRWVQSRNRMESTVSGRMAAKEKANGKVMEKSGKGNGTVMEKSWTSHGQVMEK